MSDDRTVVLNRKNHVLWVYRGEAAEGLYYDVTGVARLSHSARYLIAVLQNGKTIGLVENITEIEEVW